MASNCDCPDWGEPIILNPNLMEQFVELGHNLIKGDNIKSEISLEQYIETLQKIQKLAKGIGLKLIKVIKEG